MPPSSARFHSSGEPGRFELIVESLPIMIWVAGPDGGLQFLNRQAREYSGLAIDDLLGWDWSWVVHPADLPQALDLWNESLRTGHPVDLEFRLRRHDGEYRWFSSRGLPLRDDDGRIIRWYGVCSDIEDLKQANIRLRGTQRLFKALIERHPRGFALIGPDRIIKYVSPAVARITGFRPEEVVGDDCKDHVHPADYPQFQASLDSLLAHPGEEVEVSFRFRRPDGTHVPLGIQAVNLVPDPDVRAVVVTFWLANQARQPKSPDVYSPDVNPDS